ncbi:hypothetical protein [uncultured Vagococcus sp.]|uniref:hypothetical protein n=1 Tax=uncultured Vagococcus sp. TaxID=189676 RepID=UPI0028D8404A|nr:hypothetical protein [uncultured Vagococcus sp.]
MGIHYIELRNGETAKLDTDVSLGKMKKFKKDGTLSPNFLGKLMLLESDPKSFETDDLENAYYIAYLNANSNPMPQDVFESQLNYDLEKATEFFSEIVGGSNKKGTMQKEFIKHTTKKNKQQGGKKHPKN